MPDGFRAVVKELTAYASPSEGDINVFFHYGVQKVAVWRHHVDVLTANWGSFEGQIAFLAGSEFSFYVEATGLDRADVYAGGYLLAEP